MTRLPVGSYAMIFAGAYGTALAGSLIALRARLTRLLSAVFVAHTVSDFLQLACRAAEDRS